MKGGVVVIDKGRCQKMGGVGSYRGRVVVWLI